MKYPFLPRLLLSLLLSLPAYAGARDSADLWQEFVARPDNHPLIPNNAYAGYMRGERPIPEVPAVVDVRSFGGRGDGQTVNDAAIRRAIDAAWEAGGGAVQFPAGEFVVEGMILLHREGVVLRGAGPGKTVIRFQRPLVDVLGRTDRDTEQWNWTGGLLWVGPGDFFRWAEDESGKARWMWDGLDQGPVDFEDDPERTFRSNWESWQTIGEAGVLAEVQGSYPRGVRQFEVDDASRLTPGETVIMSWENPSDDGLWLEIAGHEVFREGNWFDGWLSRVPMWTWPVEILAVEGTQVTLAQPTRVSIQPEFGVTFRKMGANDSDSPALVQQAGVEGMTLHMANERPSYPYNRGVGWNGIFFNRALHCWARDIEILNAETAINVSSSKNVTVTDIDVDSPFQSKYISSNRVMSHDILYEAMRVHNTGTISNGVNTEWLSSGNVWSRLDLNKGTFDNHRMMAFDGIRTEIQMRNPDDARPGGNHAAGPFTGPRMVHWNIEITDSDRSVGSEGAWVLDPQQYLTTVQVGIRGAPVMERDSLFGMPVWEQDVVLADIGQVPEPVNLFEAQRALRLGADVPTEQELSAAFQREPLHPGEPYAFFSATPESGRAPLTVELDAGLSSGRGVELKAWRWAIGDSEKVSSDGPFRTVTIEEDGLHYVTLEVETAEGRVGRYTAEIMVGNPAPEIVVEVSETIGTPPFTVHFDARKSFSRYGTIVRYDWAFGDGAQSLDGASRESHTYRRLGSFTVSVRVTDDLGAVSEVVEIPIRVSREPELFARINFQPTSLPAPEGWLAEGRETFGERENGLRFGWEPRAGPPRRRNSERSPDFRYDSLVHTRGAVWEIELPNAEYEVRMAAGDATNFDSIHRILVEDVLVVDGRANQNDPWVRGRARVQVDDGRLTVQDAPGARNVKLAWIEILRVPEDGR